ncbi:conserved hypothetical protein [Ricinus communis]|uniref:Uncharacterized protein n=1 Tax=Ricinus communis TaxID=3988 RepID=B9SZ55_RICCO|nr:conserved hypothetical protein [Ricinus communis]
MKQTSVSKDPNMGPTTKNTDCFGSILCQNVCKRWAQNSTLDEKGTSRDSRWRNGGLVKIDKGVCSGGVQKSGP